MEEDTAAEAATVKGMSTNAAFQRNNSDGVRSFFQTGSGDAAESSKRNIQYSRYSSGGLGPGNQESEEQADARTECSFVGTEDHFDVEPPPVLMKTLVLPQDRSHFGSAEAHEQGVCRPCTDLARRGKCRKSSECNFCHRPHPWMSSRIRPPLWERLRDRKKELRAQAAGSGTGTWHSKPSTTQTAAPDLQGRQVWVPEEARGRVLGMIKQLKQDESGIEWCLISTAIMPDFWVPLAVARGMLLGGELYVKSTAEPVGTQGQSSAQSVGTQGQSSAQPFGTQGQHQHFAPECVSCQEPFTAHESRVLFYPCNHAIMHSDCYATWQSQDPVAAANCAVCRGHVETYTHV
jgi:hypothetical protein